MLKLIYRLACTMFLISQSLACMAKDYSMTPDLALKQLLEGNERFTQDKLEHPHRSQERRESVSTKQMPFAIVIGCSDSRVSPELVFDQGVGDLFVVRDAGNVVGPIESASIQYSAQVLHSSLIFVLGHENCGAVKAVLDKQTATIRPIAEKIEYAIQNYSTSDGSPIESAIKANVRAVVAEIKKNEVIAQLMREKKIDVVGGYYNLHSGKVELCCGLTQTEKKQ